MKRRHRNRIHQDNETRGRKPGRYSLPPFRPVMQKLLPSKDGASAAEVLAALENAKGGNTLDARAVSHLFHRSALCSQKATKKINDAFVEFCDGKKHPLKAIVTFYNVGLSPDEVHRALQEAVKRSDAGGSAPEAAWAQTAGLPFAVINTLASGLAVPIQLAEHAAIALSGMSGFPVTPIHWENMTWGRKYVEDGAVRSVIEDWILKNA